MDVVAGSVAGCQPRQGGLLVEIRRAGGNVVQESYDAIVRCVGPAIERSEADSPLIGDLIHRGRAVADPAGLGIISDDRGRVVTPNGEADPNLLVIGALRRASSWETTAAPDISVHALAIAKSIIP
jgi:uncharacterized NAD(P)/FAD-binding protein YdhS